MIDKPVDTLSFAQVFKEARIAFSYIDTMSNGWIIYPNTVSKIDTMPVVFYKTKRSITGPQQNQLYQFLKASLSKDTIVLIKR